MPLQQSGERACILTGKIVELALVLWVWLTGSEGLRAKPHPLPASVCTGWASRGTSGELAGIVLMRESWGADQTNSHLPGTRMTSWLPLTSTSSLNSWSMWSGWTYKSQTAGSPLLGVLSQNNESQQRTLRPHWSFHNKILLFCFLFCFVLFFSSLVGFVWLDF